MSDDQRNRTFAMFHAAADRDDGSARFDTPAQLDAFLDDVELDVKK